MAIGIILLAAGSSFRMGQSKQLLEIGGEQLLLKSTRTALLSKANKVIVVLGANEVAHRKIIKEMPVDIIVNPDWQYGMGSSIKKGLQELLQIIPQMEAVIVMVCDQPLLTTDHLNKIIQKFENTQNQIIASHYSDTAGVPALFGKSLFEKLVKVDNETGAKKIIQEHKAIVQTIDFPDGEIDLDTLDDYQKLVR
ncbi:MAG: nucleotidyltransferase family protein [Bacteroidia bacterium]|nr:nucleotidyltransferase family protein [Bacteroidia bacterium]